MKKSQKVGEIDMEEAIVKISQKEAEVSIPTHTMREIPKGMVAFYGTDKDGKTIEGYQTPAGAKAMKDYVESNGGTLTIDEKKKK